MERKREERREEERNVLKRTKDDKEARCGERTLGVVPREFGHSIGRSDLE
jgi:hypothetical protein